MRTIINNDGLTIVEIIVTIAILGVVICPVLSMFSFSEKINIKSDIENKSLQQAVEYIEEIQNMESLDTSLYVFNIQKGIYERLITVSENQFDAEITINTEGNMLYYIEVVIKKGGCEINRLRGSKLFIK